jgi:fido (protein-threonine AMPylation protein)
LRPVWLKISSQQFAAQTPYMSKSKPYTFWKDKANEYLCACEEGLSSEQNEQLKAYREASPIRLIFESNIIESAGTNTYGETERILKKVGEKYKISDLKSFVGKHERELFDVYFYLDQPELEIVKFEKSFKQYSEVIQHWSAFVISLIRSDFFVDNRLKEPFFTQDFIKQLHKTLAGGLLDKEQVAGEYRDFDDIILVGQDLTFPTHRLLPLAMEAFVQRANKLVSQVMAQKETDLFLVMSQITYEFVRIHPFPDFNGRLSRILLQMIALTFGIPFCVVIKGNKKGRHRYNEALKRANAIKNYDIIEQKHLEPDATLIAMSVVESFEEIDNNLKLAGLKAIL